MDENPVVLNALERMRFRAWLEQGAKGDRALSDQLAKLPGGLHQHMAGALLEDARAQERIAAILSRIESFYTEQEV